MDPVSGHRSDDAGLGGRRAGLRDAGTAVARQWRGWRQPQGLHRGAARLREGRRFLGLLGCHGRLANQDDRRSQGQDGRDLRDRRWHARPVQSAPEAEWHRSGQGHQAGRGRLCRLRRCVAAGPRRCGQHEPAVCRARGGKGRHSQTVLAVAGHAEHRAHPGSLPCRFRRQEPGTGEGLCA